MLCLIEFHQKWIHKGCFQVRNASTKAAFRLYVFYRRRNEEKRMHQVKATFKSEMHATGYIQVACLSYAWKSLNFTLFLTTSTNTIWIM